MSDPAPNFEGHEGRECGEHRTVGSHRAWCHDCTEWCYPELPCRGCKIPQLEAALTEANKQLEELRDQGCEFCEAAIDDRITDEPEFMGNFKHSWICGRCWNDQGRKLTEANKLLEQTIEVLEAAPEVDNAGRECCEDCDWWLDKAKPLLDNLKALKKEGTE